MMHTPFQFRSLVHWSIIFLVRRKKSNTYCESCLTTAQEIESILKKDTAESRRDVVEKLVSGAVCGTAPFHKNDQLSPKNMKTSCKHLLGVHHEEFRTALLGREAERLDISLCYEHSTACIGVKQHSFQGNNANKPFRDSHFEALLRDNQAIVRTVHSVRNTASKDEM